MRFELSDDERAVLTDVLELALKELRVEVRHTETRSYRDDLVRREETIRGLLERLRNG